jgi:SAM-dependent methyltransferase
MQRIFNMAEFQIPGGDSDVKPGEGTFNDTYSGTPPWDIGHPQPEFVALEERGEIAGDVLDAGCGTGEHAIYLAGRGHNVVGVDSAPAAIEKARAKARDKESSAEFRVLDALALADLKRTFDTVIDSGLFHCFSDENRAKYVKALETVVRPGGRFLVMCFSELETRPGPRRVTQDELRAAFAKNWTVNYIRPSLFESLIHEGGAKAWVASISRV